MSPRGNSLAALGGADRKAGQIVVARLVHPRHLRRLAADQRAARLPAALGDAGDDIASPCRRSSLPVAK